MDSNKIFYLSNVAQGICFNFTGLWVDIEDSLFRFVSHRIPLDFLEYWFYYLFMYFSAPYYDFWFECILRVLIGMISFASINSHLCEGIRGAILTSCFFIKVKLISIRQRGNFHQSQMRFFKKFHDYNTLTLKMKVDVVVCYLKMHICTRKTIFFHMTDMRNKRH